MTKTQAIAQTRKLVGEIYRFGHNHRFNYFDSRSQTWRESIPLHYHTILHVRSQHMVDVARDLLGKEREEYNGGEWTEYLD